MNTSTNVLVMHPDPLIRAGVAVTLAENPGLRVHRDGDGEGVAGDGCRIDVVIADYPAGLELASRAVPSMRPALADARILVLTSNDCEADVRRAMEVGVQGYVILGGPVRELLDAVSALACGGRYFSRIVAHRMMESLTRGALTGREFEVLRLVVAGESNKVIARRLQIEVGTVKSHMNAILAKLNATSRTQAAAVAIARGMVTERLPAASPETA